MKKISLVLLAVFSSLIFLSSCLNSNGTTQPTTGAFLLAQTSPDAPNIGVTINNQLFDTLHFGNYTPYVGGVNAGTYSFAVDSFGVATPSKLKSTIVIDANKYYSYFIIDSFKNLKAAFVNDVFQLPSSDSVYVRFFNFCPNTTEPISLVDATSSASLSSNRTFNDQSSNPQFISFQEIPAGAYNLALKTVSGTVLKTQTVTLTGGHVYTLFAKGTIGNTDSTRALNIGQLENYPQQ